MDGKVRQWASAQTAGDLLTRMDMPQRGVIGLLALAKRVGRVHATNLVKRTQ